MAVTLSRALVTFQETFEISKRRTLGDCPSRKNLPDVLAGLYVERTHVAFDWASRVNTHLSVSTNKAGRASISVWVRPANIIGNALFFIRR